MTEQPRPRRETVMHPRTRQPRSTSGYRPGESPAPGRPQGPGVPLHDAYLRSLMRVQLRLGLVVCALLAVALGGLPLLFTLVPSVDTVRVFGIDLPWVVLGGAVYPVLPLVAWWYVRRAERAEQDYADVVEPR